MDDIERYWHTDETTVLVANYLRSDDLNPAEAAKVTAYATAHVAEQLEIMARKLGPICRFMEMAHQLALDARAAPRGVSLTVPSRAGAYCGGAIIGAVLTIVALMALGVI